MPSGWPNGEPRFVSAKSRSPVIEGRSSVGRRPLDLSYRPANNDELEPGLRLASPHRRRLASRRGQTPRPRLGLDHRGPLGSAASPVGLTLPERLGEQAEWRPPAPIHYPGASSLFRITAVVKVKTGSLRAGP